jgi:hypothetical protein
MNWIKTGNTEEQREEELRIVSKTEEERLRERQAVTASLNEQAFRGRLGLEAVEEPEDSEQPKGWRRQGRIAKLEAEVAELKARVEALEAKNVSARKGSAK